MISWHHRFKLIAKEGVSVPRNQTKKLSEWLTTEEVGERYGVPARIVLRMIREDRLKAQKLGWQWVVHKDWLPDVWPPPVKKSA